MHLPMKRLFSLFSICFVLFSSFFISIDAKERSKELLQESYSKQAKYLYDLAIIASLEGRLGSAYRLFQISYTLSPSVSVAGAMGSLLPDSKSRLKIFWLQKALSIDPNSRENIFALFFLYNRLGEYNQSQTLIESFCQKNPSDEEAQFYLASIYAQKGNYSKASSIIKSLLQQATTPPHIKEALQRLSFSIQIRNGNKKDAIAQILERVQKEDNNLETLLSAVDELSSLRAYQEALDLLLSSKFSEKEYPDLLYVRATLQIALDKRLEGFQTLSHLLFDEGKSLSIKERIDYIKRIMQSDPQISSQSKDYLPLIKRFAYENKQEEELQNLYLSVLGIEGEEREYTAQLKLMEKLFPLRKDIPLELVRIHLLNKDYLSSDTLANNYLKNSPDFYEMYALQGSSLLLQGRKKEVISLLERGEKIKSKRNIEEKETREAFGNMLSILAEAYYLENKKDLAYQTFERSFSYDDKNALVLNNYAYYLALDGKQLERAYELIAKAVSLMPKESNILDTYAYILMLRKEFLMAEIYIRQAIDIAPQKASLYDRYAEILSIQGKKIEAIEQLKKAQKLEPSKEREEKINLFLNP